MQGYRTRDQEKVNQHRISHPTSTNSQELRFSDNRSSTSSLKKIQSYSRKHSLGYQSTVQRKGNNTGLPDKLKAGIENLSGYSMDDVKVHYNSPKPAQLHAHAYAQGTNIHLSSGQEKHLPHEAWHVVQQKQGRVKATMQMKEALTINDNPGLEHEADVMGAKASSSGGNLTETSPTQRIMTSFISHPVVQGTFIGKLVTFLVLLFIFLTTVHASYGGSRGRLFEASLNPDGLGKAGEEYGNLFKSLKNSPTEIQVESGRRAAFSPYGKPTLYMPDQLITELGQDMRAIKRGAPIEPDFADKLSTVTHELSHAKDSVVHGKELLGEKGTTDSGVKTFNVIDTELKAWASEAIVIRDSGKGNNKVLRGWEHVQKSTLNTWKKVKAKSKKNEVVSRYRRYVTRNLLDFEGPDASPRKWHEKYWDQVWPLMEAQKNRVHPSQTHEKDEL